MSYLRQDGDVMAAPYGDNVIEQGQLVTVDAEGNAKAGETGQKVFLGVADESVTGITSDQVRIRTEGAFQLAIDAVAAADLGKDVQILTPTSVKLHTGNNTVVGKIVEIVDNSTVFVKLK